MASHDEGLGTQATPTRLAVVMTVYNRKETTLACLHRLNEQEGHGATMDVFVVDDASPDGTGEAVTREFPDVKLLTGNGDLFWNGGMRVAFGEALKGDYDGYVWMNDDTHLDRHALRTLLETQRVLRERGESCAIVAGSTRHPDTGVLTYGGVGRPDPLRPLKFRLVPPGSEPRPCETMNGNIVLIPRSVAGRVGNLDPAFRQKMGDFDYGLRARAAGCSVWIAPGTIGSCATHPPRRTDERPLHQEIKRLYSVKELPPRPWSTFTRRWAGPLWPLYFASPYLRRANRLALQRLRARGDRSE